MNVRPLDMLKEMVDVLLNEYDVNVQDQRRLESVVVPRSALFNVCRGYYSATTLGKYFGKNHATILHQLGIHHEQLTWRFGGREMRLTDVHGNVVKEILS